MRFCQAQALVFSLMRDETFSGMPNIVKNVISETILNEVKGRMMEDIILLETIQTMPKEYEVFKLQFPRGEFDMVTYDQERNFCICYEIKHSNKMVKEQTKNVNYIGNEFPSIEM